MLFPKPSKKSLKKIQDYYTVYGLVSYWVIW